MIKKIIIIFVILLFGYFFLSEFLYIDSDPCDLECDNCITSEQCLKCYEECYNRID